MFFFKQKTAYEMRISDWSSDVCSSDLSLGAPKRRRTERRSSSCLLHRQRIAGAASAGGILHKNTSLDQIVDVAQGGVGRRLGNRRPFGIGQLALEPVQKRSEEHTSELQSLMRNSYAVFSLKTKQSKNIKPYTPQVHEPTINTI